MTVIRARRRPTRRSSRASSIWRPASRRCCAPCGLRVAVMMAAAAGRASSWQRHRGPGGNGVDFGVRRRGEPAWRRLRRPAAAAATGGRSRSAARDRRQRARRLLRTRRQVDDPALRRSSSIRVRHPRSVRIAARAPRDCRLQSGHSRCSGELGLIGRGVYHRHRSFSHSAKARGQAPRTFSYSNRTGLVLVGRAVAFCRIRPILRRSSCPQRCDHAVSFTADPLVRSIDVARGAGRSLHHPRARHEGGEQRQSAYLAINPMGKVPAILHGDTLVTEQVAIGFISRYVPEAAWRRHRRCPARVISAMVCVLQRLFRAGLVDKALKRSRSSGDGAYGDVETTLNRCWTDGEGPWLLANGSPPRRPLGVGADLDGRLRSRGRVPVVKTT